MPRRQTVLLCMTLTCILSLTSHPWSPRGRAATADCSIEAAAIFHDSINVAYRSIPGPITPQHDVRLRIRVAQGDITGARVRVWNTRTKAEKFYLMAWDQTFDTDSNTYDWWAITIPTGQQPTILSYFFEITDDGNGHCGAVKSYYVDDDVRFYGGGTGVVVPHYDDSRSFQITVYDSSFDVPSWMQRAIVYQIFPDRFRDGNVANNPHAGRFFEGASNASIVRSGQSQWNFPVCDHRNMQGAGFNCPNHATDNFYGGDLSGITSKIEQGYFDNLGVTVLYLNPIFSSPSNHRYDTADYFTIDPALGTLIEFEKLIDAANRHGLKILLDGVFNHVSSDSMYFDRYSRYNATGDLTSPSSSGTNDGSGACEATTSLFRSWFFFPALSSPAKDVDKEVKCAGNVTYEAWSGYSSLPKLQANSDRVRKLFWSDGTHSVGPYWTRKGGSGWRFDVGGDIDAGLANQPANDFWEGFRKAVRNKPVTTKKDVVMLGEEWGDASSWLLGNEWDSVMNYRYRSAVLGWLFTKCAGDGCSGGTIFWDNDSNANSSSGDIRYLSPSNFNARLISIWEDYPPMALKAMMNLEGSHDTNRIRFLMKKTNNNDDSMAIQRMKELWIFAFTYVGAPTIYYGDEVGLSHDGVFADGKYEDDPYNRAPFPWDDTPGSYKADTTDLLPHVRRMASIRLSYRALQDGDVHHGILIDDSLKLYGFARTSGKGPSHQTALIVLNRDSVEHTASVTRLNKAPYFLPDGTALIDALNGAKYTVIGGAVSVPITSNWAAVLLQPNKIDVPVEPINLKKSASGSNMEISWSPVTKDRAGQRELAVRYELYRGTTMQFEAGPSNHIASVNPAPFGGTNLSRIVFRDTVSAGHTYFYRIGAFNAAGQSSLTKAF